MKRTKFLLRFAVITLAALLLVISCAAFSACEPEKESVDQPNPPLERTEIGIVAEYPAPVRFCNLKVGESYVLNVSTKPEEAVDRGLTWTSDDTFVAVVDETGKVTAVSPGITTVTVETYDGAIAECKVFVSGIRLNRSSIALSEGEEYSGLEVMRISESSTFLILPKWASSDPEIVSVDDEGKLTAHSPGHTTVTAEGEDGYIVGCEVYVCGVILNKKSLILRKGSIYEDLKAEVIAGDKSSRESYSVESSDPSVVSVRRASGLKLYANEVGEAEIIITSGSGKYADKCKVTVIDYKPDEPFNFDDSWLNGEMMGIDVAYERGLISYDDLMNIAYYCDPTFKQFPDDFTAAPMYPIELPDECYDVAKESYLECINELYPGYEQFTNISKIKYFGTYGDCIAFVGYRSFGLSGGSLYVPLIVDGVEFQIAPAQVYPVIWHKL